MEIDSNINNIFLDNSLDLDNSKYLFKDDDIKLFDYQKQTISSLLNHEKGQMTIKLPKNYLSLLENEFHNKSHTYSNNFSRDIQRYLRTREKKFLLKNNMNILDRYHIKVNFGYNIGVLSNTVGSGKTLIILGFIMRNKFFKKNLLKLSYKKKIYNNTKYPSDICDVISEFLVEKDSFSLNISSNHIKKNNNLFYSNYYLKDDLKEKTIIKTNLIIVPHNLFEQWKNEINKTFLKTKYIKDKRNFKDINDILDNKYDIILCNVNKVIQLLEYLPNEKYNFERIFIDEVDIINLPRFPELNTNFLWLITTTYTRILNPKNIGFINDLFRSNYYMNKSVRSFYKFFLEKLTFSFNKTHIQEKLQLIIPNKNFIIVPNNFINTLLYNLKCESWYKYLNSYDYESLYYHILKTKSRNLIKFMLRYLLLNIIGNFDPSIEQTIQNIILNFSFDYENNASILFIIILHRIHRINYDLINRKIIHRIRHINNIVRIIKEHLLNCPICLKDHKRFINNINDFNLFQHDIHYLNDILFSIQSEKCPMNVNQLRDQLKYKIYSLKKTFKEVKKQIKEIQYIKKQLLNNNYCLQCMNKHTEDVSCIESTFYNFFVIVNINFYQFDSFFRNILNEFQPKFIRDIKYDIYQKEEYPEIDVIEEKYNVKIENMLISLKKDILNKKRCLIFSDNNYFFKNIKYELDSHSISNRTLKGNTNTINSIIRKYKNHDINVLLLNMKHCGSGINLEMSDNIYIMNFLDSETETQVIGRVNRIGKKNNLNINYYLTTHEYDFYKKIISTDKKSNIIIEEI